MKETVDIKKIAKFCLIVFCFFVLFFIMSFLEGNIEQYCMNVGNDLIKALWKQ